MCDGLLPTLTLSLVPTLSATMSNFEPALPVMGRSLPPSVGPTPDRTVSTGTGPHVGDGLLARMDGRFPWGSSGAWWGTTFRSERIEETQ